MLRLEIALTLSLARAHASSLSCVRVPTICCFDLIAIAIGVWPQRSLMLDAAPSFKSDSAIATATCQGGNKVDKEMV